MNKLAVIGNPVAHSLSPEIHAAFALQANIEVSYERILADPDAFAETARAFVDDGAVGFNVTVPFKREAWVLADTVSPEAAASEAVNTVTVQDDHTLRGDNTDGAGLVRDMTGNLGWRLEGARMLLVGAGGAVSGVIPAILATGAELIHVFNRTHERALELERRFDGELIALRAADLLRHYDIVINGTSAGLSGNVPDLPDDIIGEQTNVYDMVYGKDTTAFNRWAIAAGCRNASDGLGMLVEQAARSFTIWFGFTPVTPPVIDEIRVLLEENA